MSRLHEALEALGPRDFSDIPLDELSSFLKDTFAAALEIVNSVPRGGDGNAKSSIKTGSTLPLIAKNASDMVSIHNSAPLVDVASQEFAKSWGKPLRLGAKENPLGLSLYKMAANDRHGAWFARRSIHKGMSFNKWKSAMKHEFVESMGVVGGPGAGSIRGIGADHKLEKKTVDGVGALEVWHLSAQFPGPVAPRDFVVCLLSEDTTHTTNQLDIRTDDHYMVVSIPVEHPDAQLRDGLVRGQYESVEIIRRIKDWDQKWKSADELRMLEPPAGDRAHTSDFSKSSDFIAKGEGFDLPRTDVDAGSDLVEWIMITRSDPGGGIPRFMVERGTPSSIANDAVKFLDWATSKENIPVETDDIEAVSTPLDERPSLYTKKSREITTFEPSKATDTGIISSLTSVVKDGLDRYVPGVQEGISRLLPGQEARNTEDEDDTDDDSDTSSLDSFASAEQFTTAEQQSPNTLTIVDRVRNHDADVSSLSSVASEKTTNSSLEGKLAKLEERKKTLDSEFDKVTKREEAKAQEALSKELKEAAKVKDRLERERKKREAKYAKEMKKLEEKRQKEEKKAEERKQKAIVGDTLSQMRRERDQAKRMAAVLKQENEILRDRVGDLQRENTLIVQRVSKLNGGREILREVKTLMASPKSSKSSVHINEPGNGNGESSIGTKEQARARSTSPVATNRSSGSSINSGSKESGKGVGFVAN